MADHVGEMALGDSQHISKTLPGLINFFAFSRYVKSLISSPNFISVVASIKMSQCSASRNITHIEPAALHSLLIGWILFLVVHDDAAILLGDLLRIIMVCQGTTDHVLSISSCIIA